jgi:hypothetical protein
MSLLGYELQGDPLALQSIARRPWSDPVQLSTVAGLSLRPQLALVLATDAPAGLSPGALFLAVAGACVVVELLDPNGAVDGAFVGERLLPADIDGPVRLTSAGGESVCVPASPGERLTQLEWLATSVGGLRAGQLVCAVPATAGRPLPVAAGAWRVEGPDSAGLTVTVVP